MGMWDVGGKWAGMGRSGAYLEIESSSIFPRSTVSCGETWKVCVSFKSFPPSRVQGVNANEKQKRRREGGGGEEDGAKEGSSSIASAVNFLVYRLRNCQQQK